MTDYLTQSVHPTHPGITQSFVGNERKHLAWQLHGLLSGSAMTQGIAQQVVALLRADASLLWDADRLMMRADKRTQATTNGRAWQFAPSRLLYRGMLDAFDVVLDALRVHSIDVNELREPHVEAPTDLACGASLLHQTACGMRCAQTTEAMLARGFDVNADPAGCGTALDCTLSDLLERSQTQADIEACLDLCAVLLKENNARVDPKDSWVMVNRYSQLGSNRYATPAAYTLAHVSESYWKGGLAARLHGFFDRLAAAGADLAAQAGSDITRNALHYASAWNLTVAKRLIELDVDTSEATLGWSLEQRLRTYGAPVQVADVLQALQCARARQEMRAAASGEILPASTTLDAPNAVARSRHSAPVF